MAFEEYGIRGNPPKFHSKKHKHKWYRDCFLHSFKCLFMIIAIMIYIVLISPVLIVFIIGSLMVKLTDFIVDSYPFECNIIEYSRQFIRHITVPFKFILSKDDFINKEE